LGVLFRSITATTEKSRGKTGEGGPSGLGGEYKGDSVSGTALNPRTHVHGSPEQTAQRKGGQHIKREIPLEGHVFKGGTQIAPSVTLRLGKLSKGISLSLP